MKKRERKSPGNRDTEWKEATKTGKEDKLLGSGRGGRERESEAGRKKDGEESDGN